MKDKLTKVWKTYSTKKLAKIFESYMQSIGARKYDGRREDNSNSYLISKDTPNWCRVQLYYHKNAWDFGNEDLLIVLRKKAGNYLIVEKKDVRAFEVDDYGIKHYEEDLLKEIIEENKPLFDSIFKNLKLESEAK